MRRVRFAAEVAVWWAVTVGIWLLTLSSVNRQDLLVAAVCGLLCGSAAAAARRVVGGCWVVPPRTGAWAARLPLAVLLDTGRILAFPWRRLAGRTAEEGRFVRVPVQPGADPRATSARAAAAVLLSVTPGSYALHDDADTGELVVHALFGGAHSMEEVVRR
ncbi:MAG TPA: Na+/H+ antiporter subunit E [Frankiaceae bacterium]